MIRVASLFCPLQEDFSEMLRPGTKVQGQPGLRPFTVPRQAVWKEGERGAGALWWARLKRPVAVQLPTPRRLSRGSNLAGAHVPS